MLIRYIYHLLLLSLCSIPSLSSNHLLYNQQSSSTPTTTINERRVQFLQKARFAALSTTITKDNTNNNNNNNNNDIDTSTLSSATGSATSSPTGAFDSTSSSTGGSATGNSFDPTTDTSTVELPPVIACQVGEFSDWSSCSRKCAITDGAKGLQTRSRAVLNLNTLTIEQTDKCPTLIETQICYPPPCPMDCRVSNFTEWNGCTKPCEDKGSQTRTRTVQAVANFGGQECPVLEETKICNTFKCPDPIANCSTSIFNDCSNRGVCTMKGCECYPGYAGVDCSGVLEKDCKNDCSGHGKCRTADATCVCDVGYDGDDCAVGQCVNDCSGHGTCMTEPQLYCQCFFGYVGMDCNAKICPNDCSGHGYCGSDGNCTCLPGYSGYDCSTGACRDNCNEHGVCVDSRCECNLGYNGVSCEERFCGPECIHGDCVHDTCICREGYHGDNCDVLECNGDQTCHGHGHCDVENACSCFQGYVGAFCENQKCLNDCTSHGICLNGTCKCDRSYDGADCGIKRCHPKCALHGRCSKDGTCLCNPGYSGDSCSTLMCKNDCNGKLHGNCGNDGVCQCQGGFGGDDCMEPRCPHDCNGVGECEPNGPNGSGVCTCDDTHGGSDCGTEICNTPQCVHGYCYADGCFCQKDWTGDACNVKECLKNPVGQTCSAHGICVNGTCTCEPGYHGDVCASDVLGLCPNNCGKHGSCTSTGCDCQSGYRGVSCDVVVCPSNCTNHGVCVHGTCTCDNGWSGLGCEQPLCPTNCTGHGTCVAPDQCECIDGTWIENDCSVSLCGDSCDAEFGTCQLDKTCDCNNGYGGADCSCKTHDPMTFGQSGGRTAQVCGGHGVCAARQCFCDTKDNWGGDECNERLCPNECSSHGECTNGTCTCNIGWDGDDCSVTGCPAGDEGTGSCSGHGICMGDDLAGRSCVCYGGWGGSNANCDSLTCDYNCHNKGLCNNGTCFCQPPYTGEWCESSTCNPECNTNHGTCQEGNCICEKTWWGSTCDNKECIHGEWDVESLSCKCRLGWGGNDCNTTSLCLPGTCLNAGYCANDQDCVCTHEFTGARCEQVVCPNTCNGHGVCNDETFRCDCTNEWDGLLCEKQMGFGTAEDIMAVVRDEDHDQKMAAFNGNKGLRGIK